MATRADARSTDDQATATVAVVTGGGTAGHVLPAIAVADALVAAGYSPSAIHYAGTQRGIETTMLPDTPYPHTFFDVVGFQRSITRRNLAFVPKMLAARRAAIDLLKRLRPKVVVSVGGYGSMPAIFAARRLKIPIVVVSYDLLPGRASQLSARSATACAVAFPNSPLPRATMTGAPVRQAVLSIDRTAERAAARQRLGVDDDRFLVAVMGGSLGSKLLNDSIDEYARDHAHDGELAIRQVAGSRFVDTVSSHDNRPHGLHHDVLGFEHDMPSVYAAADLLIGRGGASTVHEVAVTGTPAILVPWAGSAEDHQTLNVKWLVDQNGAIALAESDIGQLANGIERLRSDTDARAELSASAHTAGQVHRSGALAELIVRVMGAAGEGPRGASMSPDAAE